MNIPPIIGLVISLSIGIIIGTIGTYQYIDKKQITANTNQLAKDAITDIKIEEVTVKIKKANKVKKVLAELKSKKAPVNTGMTNEEINAMCINNYAPDKLVQSLRSEANRARKRLKDL